MSQEKEEPDEYQVRFTNIETISQLKAVETAIELLAGNIINLRTELLVIKALVNQIVENTHTKLE